MRVSKNDVYCHLIDLGRRFGYLCIPEFRVWLEGGTRRKEIDLVWVIRDKCSGELKICYAFEIEACDVSVAPNKELMRHFRDLPRVARSRRHKGMQSIVVLYTWAEDRNWNHRLDVDRLMLQRQVRFRAKSVIVLDARDLAGLAQFG